MKKAQYVMEKSAANAKFAKFTKFTSSHKDNVKLREDKIVPEELMLTQSIV